MHPTTEADLSKKDPTLPVCHFLRPELRTLFSDLESRFQAQMHSNEPSKGAKIDAELMEDDAEELRKKGIKK